MLSGALWWRKWKTDNGSEKMIQEGKEIGWTYGE